LVFRRTATAPPTWQQWINNIGNNEFIFATIALSLNAAAYMSEDLRSGIRALPPTQLEAARALGLSYVSAMRKVILPQALRVAVPPLTNQSLGLFKATSLAMAIGFAEMTLRPTRSRTRRSERSRRLPLHRCSIGPFHS
jgi:polar amino acid transport system permease protein